MAQGDPSLYMRSMKGEREGPDAQFMVDGFDRWAESEAPSRVGGAHKTPSEFRHRRHHGRNPLKGGRRGHPMVPRRSSRSHSRSSSRSSRSSRSSEPSESESSESESEREVGGDMGLGRRRHRRRHHRRGRGDQVSDTEESEEDVAMGHGRRRGRRSSRSSSRSSRSSSRSSVTSVPSMLSAGSGRRRHRRGGDLKSDVDAAFNIWYSTSIAGKPLANWSTVPGKVKEIVDKLKEVWDWLTRNATGLKAAFNKVEKLKVIATKMEAIGLGRRHAKAMYRAFKHRRGGDAFDDKLSSLNIKGLYDTAKNYNETSKKADAGLRGVYNTFAAVRDNADDVKNAVDASPASQTVKDKAKSVVDSIKKSGFGRKGKRAPSKRNMLVSKLMREHGLSLPEASRKASQMMKGGEL